MSIVLRVYRPGDEVPVHCLVRRVFDQFIRDDYNEEGQQMFARYIDPEAIARHQCEGCQMLLAETAGTLAGILEMRDFRHISMLFVDPEFQRRGIARSLIDRAVTLIRRVHPDLACVTVFASPFAVPIYGRLGFTAAGPETTVQGIRYTPMERPL